jgi:tetratricopeptide (TPR) repeat protein
VATDRAALLRHAEDLLREGKLDQAIAEYRRIVDDQPRDWNSANVLGDLYLRAGQLDRAVEEFARSADSLAREGFLSKAGALYKKILKIHPHDEQTLLCAADIAAEQKLIVDAQTYLKTAYEQRQRRGDTAGTADIIVRQASLDSSVALELSEAAVVSGDLATGIATLQARLKKSPNDLDVLSRLVEVSVSGGRFDVATAAQSELADAYLTAEAGAEARFVAEDLVARHPGDRAHIERLRRALTMLGEDPDATMSARLPAPEPEMARSPQLPIAPTRVAPPPVVPEATAPVEAAAPRDEVDSPAPARPHSQPPKELDEVFADLREEAARRVTSNNPDEELAVGLAFYRAGQLDFAVPRLEAASRVPAHRFSAAATLGRICLERGETWLAIDWFERAAEAQAPTPADAHRLLYELADALEGAGEIARALAILLELGSEAGDYQDVAARIDRLSKAQARG